MAEAAAGLTPPIAADNATAARYRALGQAADCAWTSGCREPVGVWAPRYVAGWAAGNELVGWDRYGRFVGRARVCRDGTTAHLEDAWLARGRLRAWSALLAHQVLATGVQSLTVTHRGRTREVRLARLLPADPRLPPAPLHPVLAGMAAADAEEVIALGQAVALLARDRAHAQLPVVDIVQRVKRAQGSGQLWLRTAPDGSPSGLMLWARPSDALRAALTAHRPDAFHAADWNAGGEPVVLAVCAHDAEAARAVGDALMSLPAAGDTTLHVRLTDGRGHPALVPVAAADWRAFADWLASALPDPHHEAVPCC